MPCIIQKLFILIQFKEIERNQMIEMELASRESEEERSKRGQERYFFSFENGTEVTYINK